MGAQGRAMRMAGTMAHYPGPSSDYPDSPESHKYLVSQLPLMSLLPLAMPVTAVASSGLLFGFCSLLPGVLRTPFSKAALLMLMDQELLSCV